MSRSTDMILLKVVAVIAAVVMAAALGACSRGESNVVAGNHDGVLHIGNGSEPQSLDPHVMSGSPEVRIAGALFDYSEQLRDLHLKSRDFH